jgi:hypothetical protein
MNGTEEANWSVEVTIGQERVFGLYSNNNILVKDELMLLETARERLGEALSSLKNYTESPRTENVS